MKERTPRIAGPCGAIGLAALLLAGGADAQVPSWTAVHATPLPGPAPSAVVAAPPLAAPAGNPWNALPPTTGEWTGPSTSAPSSWDALREAEAELARREEDLARCRTRLGEFNTDLGQAQEHLRRLEAGEEALRTEVLGRMILLDRVSRGGTARLVLTARDPAEADFRAGLLRRLVRVDAELAQRYAAVRQDVETARADLARKLAGQQELERQLDERRQQLSDEVERHRRLLSVLSAPDAVHGLAEQSRGELEGVADALGLRAAASDPALERFAADAVAVPASFPARADAVHGGLAVDLPAGAAVVAPAAGTVAFAGVLDGYGPAVLIRTASGAGLLLGHLAALSVGVGDAVAPGTPVGETAPSYSPLLPPLVVDLVGDAVHES